MSLARRPFELCSVALVMTAAAGNAAGGEGSAGLDACKADIHRLCEPVYPDEKLIASCLVRRRAELSRACAELMADPPADPDDD